ncbi:hypothetical protein IWW38_001595, partial [Coemansia aciculifera]
RRRVSERQKELVSISKTIEHCQHRLAYHHEKLGQLTADTFILRNLVYPSLIRYHRWRIGYHGEKQLGLYPVAHRYRSNIDRANRDLRFLYENDEKLRLGEFFIIGRRAFEAALGGVNLMSLNVEDIPEGVSISVGALKALKAAFGPNGAVAQRNEVLRMIYPIREDADDNELGYAALGHC